MESYGVVRTRRKCESAKWPWADKDDLTLRAYGICQHPSLNSDLLFKGGTCLKKCYFETYRFSEDLDFTVTNPELLNEKTLRSTFTEVAVPLARQDRRM